MVLKVSRFFAAFVLLSGLLCALPALAGPFEDALPGFVTDDFSDTAEAIEKVAASGHPRAAILLDALSDGRLLYLSLIHI